MLYTPSGDALHLLRLILDTPSHEGHQRGGQRYKAVLAVIAEGKTVTDVAVDWRVSRQTLHTWLTRYEAGGLEALGSHMDCVARNAAHRRSGS